MAKNAKLRQADKEQNDEFYTQYEYIQREINAHLDYNADVFKNKTILLPCDDPEWSNFTKFFAQNFEAFGLKKLISTSYAVESKNNKYGYQPTLFETGSSQFDKKKTRTHGKIFILDRDINGNGKIDIEDLQWSYLKGDGDFRSEEVKALRDEADIIITNPPFSLFREFVYWLMESDKKFIILGNQNAITYKEIFPYIKDNKIWLGSSIHSGGVDFRIPDDYPQYSANVFIRNGHHYINLAGVRWFTNVDHGQRHQPLELMTMADNIKFSRHKEVKNIGYKRYDNYDALNIPFTDSIPCDYDGLMGVPITYMDKYCPDQFDIIDGIGRYSILHNEETKKNRKYLSMIDGKAVFFRIIIRKRKKS